MPAEIIKIPKAVASRRYSGQCSLNARFIIADWSCEGRNHYIDCVVNFKPVNSPTTPKRRALPRSCLMRTFAESERLADEIYSACSAVLAEKAKFVGPNSL